jgi:endoglucanase
MPRKTVSALLAITLALATPAAASAEPAEQVTNGGFDSGTAPWWWTANAPAAVVDGRLCTNVPAGTTNPWDVITGQNEINLEAGASYAFAFTASASTPVSIRANVQLQDPPYTAELSQQVPVTGTATRGQFAFTSAVTTTKAQVAFQIGGNPAGFTFCVDDVSLAGGTPPPPYTPDTGPRVRVNQVGYLPNSAKHGTLVTTSTQPVAWQLHRADGTVAASGTTKPQGIDPTSRQNTHLIDFSSAPVGKGYTLSADGETSVPFDIGGDGYQRLRSDSLTFFYHQRSGIPIDAVFVGPAYARPAGHLGVAPNQGDTDVACQPGVCDYRLDVRGGWYDAGDQGKYVVNGGISVAQLMSEFERVRNHPGALGDGGLRIPERHNGVPDILDEARWELEFLLRMQVPAGEPFAGMAHHKVHDNEWTGIPQLPNLDPKPRELHPVSTAATLNLAAAAAQCARVFRPYDRVFADRCLTAAKLAWAAAKANPAVYASTSDGNGGGTYDDTNVTDEFYWAAAELYLTTGTGEFRDAVMSSPLHTADLFTPDGFSWQSVAALGRLDLATVPSRLPDRAKVRRSVVAGADKLLATARAQAYEVAYAPGGRQYVWGSNSQVLNNLVVIATGYDLTGNTAYRDAVLNGLDYVLGRNPLNMSYVTGYGERDSHNQHHRFWAHESDPSLPNPPAGALAGGPNSGIQDPVAQDKLKGCAAAMCYIDDNGSYSTNEVAINWNSALAWVAGFAAEQAEKQHCFDH